MGSVWEGRLLGARPPFTIKHFKRVRVKALDSLAAGWQPTSALPKPPQSSQACNQQGPNYRAAGPCNDTVEERPK